MPSKTSQEPQDGAEHGAQIGAQRRLPLADDPAPDHKAARKPAPHTELRRQGEPGDGLDPAKAAPGPSPRPRVVPRKLRDDDDDQDDLFNDVPV